MTAASSFVVHVGHLRRSPGLQWRRRWREPMADLVVTGSMVPEELPVELDVVLEAVLGGIRATGVVRFSWVGACRRCLQMVSGVRELAVAEIFAPGSDDEDTYPLLGDLIDVEPLMRDAVLLELPPAPLCHPGCRGLCPICGADRNVVPCHCTPGLDSRWAALEQLSSRPAQRDEMVVPGEEPIAQRRRTEMTVSSEEPRSGYPATGPTTR